MGCAPLVPRACVVLMSLASFRSLIFIEPPSPVSLHTLLDLYLIASHLKRDRNADIPKARIQLHRSRGEMKGQDEGLVKLEEQQTSRKSVKEKQLEKHILFYKNGSLQLLPQEKESSLAFISECIYGLSTLMLNMQLEKPKRTLPKKHVKEHFRLDTSPRSHLLHFPCFTDIKTMAESNTEATEIPGFVQGDLENCD
ncbi:hypothetical protein H671_5g13689 [Cricetulus griseus]|uniref:Uncharacterized protein n=1 Tax=Cricetulus griseus TaxID=10029 RepID=A0A061I053_CRIGR|nr:hypothetical protein H671_5g13689 [Cricetulus griseus]